MEKRETILNELREISPVVAAIAPLNVFSVPEGYFETLPEIISGRLEMPEGSALLERIGQQMPQYVPAGYFDTLADTILAQVHEQDMNAEAQRSMPQDVPAGYFDNLASGILSRIKSGEQSARDEISQLSPLLAAASRQMPNDVPVGYFEFFADSVNHQRSKKETKVVSIFQRKAWVRYAAAAVVTGVIAIGALMMNRNSHGDTESLSAAQVELEQKLSNVNDVAVEKLLATEESGAEEINTGDADAVLLAASLSSDKLEDVLKQLPDDAIQKYVDDQISVKGNN